MIAFAHAGRPCRNTRQRRLVCHPRAHRFLLRRSRCRRPECGDLRILAACAVPGSSPQTTNPKHCSRCYCISVAKRGFWGTDFPLCTRGYELQSPGGGGSDASSRHMRRYLASRVHLEPNLGLSARGAGLGACKASDPANPKP